MSGKAAQERVTTNDPARIRAAALPAGAAQLRSGGVNDAVASRTA